MKILMILVLTLSNAATLAQKPTARTDNETRVFCEIVSDDDDYVQSAERRLFDYLFGKSRDDRRYLPSVRPRRNSLLAVDVSVQLSLLSINSLDDKNQELSTTGYMMMEWRDDFLSWNPRDFENLTNVVVQPDLIWLPSDIGIENSVDAIYQSNFRTEFRAIVDYEGKVAWTPGGRITTSCKLDVTFYPYDYQSCVISLSSWAYSDRHVHLTTSADRIDLKDYNINGEWHIIETKARAGVRFYGEPYSYVMFEISIQRKFYYHLINILLPCTLLSGLIILVFKLPAESGEKTGLGITILLSFSVFLLMIAESLPKTSDSLPIIAFYLTFLLIASSTSLLITVVSLRMYHATGDRTVPLYVRRTLKFFTLISFIKFPHLSYSGAHGKVLSELVPRRYSTGTRRNTITQLLPGAATETRKNSRKAPQPQQQLPTSPGKTDFDTWIQATGEVTKTRLSSPVRGSNKPNFATLGRSPYLTNYSSPISSTLPCPPSGKNNEKSQKLIQDAMLATHLASSLDSGTVKPSPAVEAEFLRLQERLADYLTEVTSKLRKAEHEEQVKNDWKLCSLCVDRVAFRFFLLIVGSVSMTMVVGLPVAREISVSNHW